ncbi:hypothetical protein DL766_005355 [Monosporascus sp. MC13-8B]|uniref:Protein kinase domain-containing protein n=1 Tax=Monosporascus cannonballus TaxID=155416 RepID=A0ABY0H9H8_9PEZI|nr:hypothetical protein DL762_003989 [Monosporascus cannonballus]RYO95117.1 hypothetical protein DL763_003815 [Monosporascus cannonballus]RYP29487.1 hypothetical protein DL766_005355 [Monosporascus sp. MC13-8B]
MSSIADLEEHPRAVAEYLENLQYNQTNENGFFNTKQRRFTFIERISEGGAGEVFLFSENDETGGRIRQIAVKVVLYEDSEPSDFFPNEAEQSISPIFKMIDFGEAEALDARASNDPDKRRLGEKIGIVRNIYDLGLVMMLLATGTSDDDESLGSGTLNLLDFPLIDTFANRALADAVMDNDLKCLISWCIAKKPGQRPSLESLHNLCQTAFEGRTAGFYADDPTLGPYETDEQLRSFVQDMILDPPMDDDEMDIA